MTDLARLTVRLEADNARLQRDLDKAQAQVNKYKTNASAAFSKVGAAIGVAAGTAAVGLAVLVKKQIDAADQFSLLAQKTGISVEALSQLDYAAKQSGIEDLSTGLIKFNKSISEAALGSKSAADAFKAIGIEVKDLKNADGSLKSTEELLTLTAEGFAKHANGANKSTAATELFSKAGAELIPFLNEGAEGIGRLRKEADKLGLTISTETAQAANDFNDSLDKISFSVAGVGRKIVTDLAGPMRDFSDFMSDPATIDSLAAFGTTLVKSLGAAVETVTALTSGIQRLYGFISNAPTNLVDTLDRIAKLEKEIADTKVDEGGFDFLNDLSPQRVEEVTQELKGLYELRDKLFAQQREELNRPPPAPKPEPPRIDSGAMEAAAKKAAEERKKIAEATAQAETTIFNAGLDRRQSALEAALDQQKVTQEQYYRQLEAIQNEGIDQEIKQRQAELATADPAERIKLLAEIEAFQTKKLQVTETINGKIAADEKKLTDALQADLAAYADQLNTLGRSYQRALDDFGKGPAQRRYDEGRNSIDDNVSQQRMALENQRRAKDITDQQYSDSLKALEAFHGLAIEQWNTYYDQIEERSRDFSLGFSEAFQEYADAVKNVGQALGEDLTSALDNAVSQTADLAANTILWGEGGTEALKALGRSILTDVVSSLIKAGIQMAINFALQKAFSAASTATALGEAATLATAWTPAAIAASIATLGSADAIGLAAYATAQASGQAVTGIGFSEGGYTGNVGRGDIAGVVHGQEYVLNADAVARIGTRNLDAMNDGRMTIGRGASTAMAAPQFQIINNAPGIKITPRSNGIQVDALPELMDLFETQLAAGITSGRSQLASSISNKFGVGFNAVR